MPDDNANRPSGPPGPGDTLPPPQKGDEAKDPNDPLGLIGRTLDGRYTVEVFIGAGGMGAVYQGRQLAVDRKIAIKVLYPDKTTEESVERFRREAKSASALSHPNTITIYDFGRVEDVNYIVMELLEGQSLTDLILREAPLPPERVVHILCQVLSSLDEAHRNGIIHRDIKPDNIHLRRMGDDPDQVTVLDFGIARLHGGARKDVTLTQAGMIFGTPRYMSVEQAKGGLADARSDLYSVGIILFEMLMGQPPFVADDPVSLLIQQAYDPPPPFETVRPDISVPPGLVAATARALEKEPDKRYSSAIEMIEHLRLAIGKGATMTGSEPVAEDSMHDANTVARPALETTPPTDPGGSSGAAKLVAFVLLIAALGVGIFLAVRPSGEPVVTAPDAAEDVVSDDDGGEIATDGTTPEEPEAPIAEPIPAEVLAWGAERVGQALGVAADAAEQAGGQDWVRLVVVTRPSGAAVTVSSHNVMRRDGAMYLRRSDGDGVRIRVSARHYQTATRNLDLSDVGDDVLETSVTLRRDECDPHWGPPDPWECQ